MKGSQIISHRIIPVIIFLFFISGLYLFPAQDSSATTAEIKTDSSKVDIRKPSEKELDAYRSQSEFQYNIGDEEISENFIQLLMRWIKKNIFDKLFGSVGDGIPAFIYIMALLLIVIAFVYIIMKSRYGNIFSRSSSLRSGDTGLISDDITGADFPALLQKALGSRDYRSAVRIRYLMALKDLSEKSIIRWAIDKTNSQYRNEINDRNIRNKFTEISGFYEAVWYGDFRINERVYKLISDRYGEFNSIMGSAT